MTQDLSDEQKASWSPLAKGALRGVAAAVLLLGVFLLTGSLFKQDYLKEFVGHVYGHPILFYGLYVASELILSFFPPELFTLTYVFQGVSLPHFIALVILLAAISYMAGIVNYILGRYFSHTKALQKADQLVFSRYRAQLDRYGQYFLLAGAVTPLPFAVASMLTGVIRMPFGRYLLISSSRFIRFAIYSWFVWTLPHAFFKG